MNTTQSPIDTAPKAFTDLSIKQFWADDSTLDFGQTLTMRLHVANDGTEKASSVKTVFYWSPSPVFDPATAVRIDADSHGTLKPGELDTNEYETIKYKHLAELGSGYVFGVIDAESKIDESDEGNNVSEGVYVELNGGLPHQADLQIEKIWAEDATLSYGQDLMTNLHVANDGTAAAKSVKTTFYWSATDHFDFATAHRIDADGHGTLKAGELDTNEHEKIKYKDLAKFGSGYVFGVIDAEGKIDESDEGNNVSEGVYVELNGGLPHQADLQIERIWAEDATLSYGQDLMINLHVANDGTAAAKSVKTTFYWSATDHFDFATAHRIDADGHGTLKAGELDTNEHEKINYKDLAKFGSGYVFGVIDAEGKIDESDEGNNVSEGVYVELNGGKPHLADLSVAHITADDPTLDLGQSLVMRLHVQNQGTADAKSVETNFYWSATDQFDFETAVEVDSDSHGTLKIGEYDDDEYEHISYSDLRALGDGFIFAVIDAEGAIMESNEANNVSDGFEFFLA